LIFDLGKCNRRVPHTQSESYMLAR
jgi:hypothetical protein